MKTVKMCKGLRRRLRIIAFTTLDIIKGIDYNGIIVLLFSTFLLSQADSYFQYIGAISIILSFWRKK